MIIPKNRQIGQLGLEGQPTSPTNRAAASQDGEVSFLSRSRSSWLMWTLRFIIEKHFTSHFTSYCVLWLDQPNNPLWVCHHHFSWSLYKCPDFSFRMLIGRCPRFFLFAGCLKTPKWEICHKYHVFVIVASWTWIWFWGASCVRKMFTNLFQAFEQTYRSTHQSERELRRVYLMSWTLKYSFLSSLFQFHRRQNRQRQV